MARKAVTQLWLSGLSSAACYEPPFLQKQWQTGADVGFRVQIIA